jgi:protein-S-isoprenylcysteine O-methyltransferase Ste14
MICGMLAGMKSAYVFKFLFVAALGALFAALIHADAEKWHQLGKDAFLTYQAGKFEQNMASPGPLWLYIVVVVIFVAGVAACYEFCGYMGEKLLSRSQARKEHELATSAVERL